MTQAPDAYIPAPPENKYRFARVHLVHKTTTYETRQFLSRRDFLEHLAAWNRAGLPNLIWAYYEAPAA